MNEDGQIEDVEVSSSESDFELHQHPNEMVKHQKKHIYTGFVRKLNNFDEKIMKPIFIYKYSKFRANKSLQLFELFQHAGTQIEHEFG